MVKRRSEESKLPYILISLLAILCIGYSTVQTAKGYELATGGELKAWVYATMISIGLVLLNILLWQNLKARRIIRALIVGGFYLIIASFSFAANFNAFFSEFMKEELLYDDMEKLQADLRGIETRAYEALENTNNAKFIEERVRLLKTTLIQQILNPGNPGYGSKSQKIAEELSSILGVELTIPDGSPQLIARSFERQIDELLDTKLQAITEKSNKHINKISQTIENLQARIDSAKITQEDVADDIIVIEQGIKVYNTIGEETSQMINDTSIFNFQRITAENIEIGKITHSFKSALKKEYFEGALFAVGLSAFIDLIVPIMIVILNLLSPAREYKFKASFPKRGNRTTSYDNSNIFPKRSENKGRDKDDLDRIIKGRGKTKR